MNNHEIRHYEMLVRVRDFGAAHTELFPPTSLGAQAFKTIGEAIDDLGQHAATQVSGRGAAREGVMSKAVARRALRAQIDAIIRTARATALDDPGLEGKFRLPRSGSDQALVSTARAFARDAAPLAKRFVQHDLPKDFLDDLEQRIEDFERAIQDKQSGKDTHVAAAASIAMTLEKAMAALTRLDAIVPNKLRSDSAALTVWERARHVEARMARKTPAAPTPPAAPTAPAATATA